MEVHAAGRADLAVALEVGGERLLNPLETGRHGPADLRLDHPAKKRTTRSAASSIAA
jgi:hypothetical protein